MSERLMLHQVHPTKLSADIGAAVLSSVLLWQHRLVLGLSVRYGLAVLGSVAVLRWAELEPLRATVAGRYVLAHMSPVAQAVRLAGDGVLALGAWHRRPAWLILGAAIVLAGWSQGLFAKRFQRI
jgi:hypothetical protein